LHTGKLYVPTVNDSVTKEMLAHIYAQLVAVPVTYITSVLFNTKRHQHQCQSFQTSIFLFVN